MSKKLNIGVIGAGRIGKVHSETLAFRLRNKATIAAITDLNRTAAEDAAARFGIPKVAAGAQEILKDPGIDAVLICSSTDTHADLVVEAASAQKHIFCEKPIDLTLAKIDRAVTAAIRAGVKLQVGFNRRFDPNFARVRRAIADGEIGTPH
ncbi:MAG TPA: Gfo/Idh/MocA family oxidoreductase, partial [Bryobacteraceae bacterium]